MSNPWDAQIAISPSIAIELLTQQFPELQPITLKRLPEGWDNTPYLINDKYIFRFPRREIALPCLESEIRLLPWVASHLSLAIPNPKFIGKPSSTYPWPFMGYEMIQGHTACSLKLSEKEKMSLAPSLGSFLANLHKLNVSEAQKRNILPDQVKRSDKKHLITRIQKHLEMLKEQHLELDFDHFLKTLKSAYLKAELSPNPSVCHGDFYIRHILLDDTNKLSGIIDWGDIHLGDPAVDLSIAHSLLPFQAHSVFIRNYGSIKPETWALAYLRSAYSLTNMLLFAQDKKDRLLVQEAKEGLLLLQKTPYF